MSLRNIVNIGPFVLAFIIFFAAKIFGWPGIVVTVSFIVIILFILLNITGVLGKIFNKKK